MNSRRNSQDHSDNTRRQTLDSPDISRLDSRFLSPDKSALDAASDISRLQNKL